MTVNKYLLPVFAIVALLGTVGFAQFAGDWIVSGKQIYNEGNMTAADIKGWMTLGQVAEGLGLPVDVVFQLAGVADMADVTADTALKDVEGLVEGFEVGALRTAAADYLDGGASVSESQSLPAVVESTPEPTREPAAVEPATAETPHVPQGVPQGTGEGTGPTPLPPGQILPADEIKGRMTLAEVADQCAVPLDALLAALNLPADYSPATQLKTLVSEMPGFEIQAVRDAVVALQGN